MGGRLINDSGWKYWQYGPRMREMMLAIDRRNEEIRRKKREEEFARAREEKLKLLQEEAWLCWAI